MALMGAFRRTVDILAANLHDLIERYGSWFIAQRRRFRGQIDLRLLHTR